MVFFKRRKFIPRIGRKSAVPDGLWMKCSGCKQAVYKPELESNNQVCPSCGYHYKMGAHQRLDMVLDPNSFEETHADIECGDPLGFTVAEVDYSYTKKVAEYVKKTHLKEAMVTGFGRIEGVRTVVGAMEFGFGGASMGSLVGEKFCLAAEDAIYEHVPLVMFSASGGARMQEGILSLMQMAKTAEAVRSLNEAGVPYISVVTDPTSGGVYASFASLGDITISEPGAYVGFAGKRVIEGALKVKLPEGFQTAEYQYNNGFVDQIIKRGDLRSFLGKLLCYLAPQ